MIKSYAFVLLVATFSGIISSIPHTFTNTFTTLFEERISMIMLSQFNVSMVTMPLPIRLALCKLMQVSQGKARTEILRAFEFMRAYNSCYVEVPRLTDLLQKFTIIFLNKIYVNDTKDLHPHFLEKSSTSKFGVHVEKKKFSRPKSALAYINRWFETVSLKRIRDILDHDEVNVNTSILAISAAHIKSTWSKPFNILHTKNAKFRTPNNTIVPVQMMTQRDSYLYYHDHGLHFQIVSLPLISYGMSMTFLLPDAPGGFGRVARRILDNPTLLQNARHLMRHKMIGVSLPRFRIKSTHIWDEALKLLGVFQIFNSTYSGLDGILKSNVEVHNMFLSLVKQKVVLEVDEMGAMRLGIPKDKSDELTRSFPLMKSRKAAEEFVADRPFLFSIDMQMTKGGDQSMFLVGAYYGPD